MQYKYVAYNPSGEMVKGTMEADSEQRAEEKLWKSEMTILTLKEKKASASLKEQLPSIYGVKRPDIVNFSRDLNALLSSGIGIYPALTMLYDRAIKTSFKNLIRELLVSVETGGKFSDACAEHPGIFSPFYIRMMKVGEEIGNLENMLDQVTVQMIKEDEIKKKVKGAMTYPAIVLIVAIGAIVALITFVVPAMSGLFDQFGGELPLTTRLMVSLSDFFSSNKLILFAGTVLLIGGSMMYFRTPRGKRTKDTIVLKIPVVSRVVIMGYMARTARNMALLISGGVTITDILDLIVETSENVHFKKAFATIRSDVSEGQLLSQAMKNQPLVPAMMYQVIGVGELTGRLEPNLESAADFYARETDSAVERATGMLTPVMTIGLGGMVALIALSVYQPIYGIAGQIQ